MNVLLASCLRMTQGRSNADYIEKGVSPGIFKFKVYASSQIKATVCVFEAVLLPAVLRAQEWKSGKNW